MPPQGTAGQAGGDVGRGQSSPLPFFDPPPMATNHHARRWEWHRSRDFGFTKGFGKKKASPEVKGEGTEEKESWERRRKTTPKQRAILNPGEGTRLPG